VHSTSIVASKVRRLSRPGEPVHPRQVLEGAPITAHARDQKRDDEPADHPVSHSREESGNLPFSIKSVRSGIGTSA
jgi:hypothetical protein